MSGIEAQPKQAGRAPLHVDTHAHLAGYGAELPTVLERARAAGVGTVVAVGTDAETSRHALGLVRASLGRYGWPRLAASAGLHPHDASRHSQVMPILSDLLAEARAEGLPASIGETGLDYYRNLSPRGDQRAAFWAHIELAHRLALPLIVHDRDAHDDILAILRAAAPFPGGGVMHCFSGDLAMGEACVDLGLHISFAGPLTFPSAQAARAAAAALPRDYILVETDCPYLAPIPHRGKRNEPAYVVHTAAALAQSRGESAEATAAWLDRNTDKLWFPQRSGVNR